jgi:hypothetical protein
MKREGMQGLCGVKQKENVEKQEIEDCQYQDHGLENARGTYWEILNSYAEKCIRLGASR